MVDDQEMQLAVATAAVELVADAGEPDARRDLDIDWPVDRRQAYRDWQPQEVSPIVKHNLEHLRASRRQAARDASK